MSTFQIFNIIIPDSTIDFPLRSHYPDWAPIFVVGCPRSGTTLVGECVAAFNDVESVGESLFIRYLWRLITDLHLGINDKTTIVPYADEKFRPNLTEAVGRLCDDLYEGLRKQNTKHIVDHTPWNGACLPLLARMYPNCKIVHVVRNPIAVSKSLTQSFHNGREWAQGDSLYHAKLWNKMVQRIDDDIATLNVSSTKIYYEDICLKPIETLNGIAVQLNLNWNDSALLKTEVLYASSLSSEEQPEEYLTKRRKEVHRDVEKWPLNMDKETRDSFSNLTQAIALRNGYIIDPKM
ncbi:MAG: repeat-containing protein [Bacteroidetes bacterium]|nr:repeat-containing protein [Bacteroidota bacterium]